MKSLLEELKEHQDKIEGLQEKSLAGFSDQITEMSADVAATMDAIADLYEQITSVQDQLATIEAKTETSATRAEAAPGTGNSTETADTTAAEEAK